MIKIKYIYLFPLILFLNSSGDNIDSRFQNLEDIHNQSYILKGWVPAFIPKDCFNISVINNLDNNHFYGVFSFGDRSFIIDTNLIEINRDDVIKELNRIHNPSYPDWFIQKNKIMNNKRLLFRKSSYFYFIIDEEELKCFYFG